MKAFKKEEASGLLFQVKIYIEETPDYLTRWTNQKGANVSGVTMIEWWWRTEDVFFHFTSIIASKKWWLCLSTKIGNEKSDVVTASRGTVSLEFHLPQPGSTHVRQRKRDRISWGFELLWQILISRITMKMQDNPSSWNQTFLKRNRDFFCAS